METREICAYVGLGTAAFLTVVGYCCLLLRTGRPLTRLVVRPGEALPAVCLCCGRAAAVGRRQTFFLSAARPVYVPRGGGLLGLAAETFLEVASAVGTYYVTRERFDVEGQFCRRHQFHWPLRHRLILALLFASWPFAVYATWVAADAAMRGRGGMLVMAGAFGVALCGWAVMPLLLRATAVRLAGVTGEGLVLVGVHRKVLKAVSRAREAAAEGAR